MCAELPPAETNVPFERVGAMVRQLTHDVRNGLNSMELQAAYISDLVRDPEDGADALAELKRLRGMFAEQGRALQRFAARFRTGKPETVNYPAKLLLEDYRERLMKTQPDFAPQVAWTDDLAEEVIAVDPEMIFAALGEFFQNAEHFQETGPPVTAQAGAKTGRFQIELREPRTTVASPPATWGCAPLVSTRRGGCGLGLFHARQLLAALGGGVELAHDATTARLTTRIFLPLVR